MEAMERTEGDGIDNSTFNEPPINSIMNTKRSLKILQSLKPIEVNSKLYYLTPKFKCKVRPVNYVAFKQKEPKFVPCEPYKAAVEPLVSKKIRSPRKIARNNMELQSLVSQLSETRRMELAKPNTEETCKEMGIDSNWQKEREVYEHDIHNLRLSNSLLENQLKFQSQVNSELKTLLVAAVGEDLENRVQHLTEDKLSLARELLKSANHLTSHQEQTEWLSGQCEVWRSKFLASSVMVEELAKWKSALTNRLNELQDVVKTLLDERKKIRTHQLELFSNLNKIGKHLMTDKYVERVLKYGNIMEVSGVNNSLSKDIKSHLNVCDGDDKVVNCQQTVAERDALRLLNNPVTISNNPDALSSAVLGAASSIGNNQSYLQYTGLHPCCAHCQGTIQNI